MGTLAHEITRKEIRIGNVVALKEEQGENGTKGAITSIQETAITLELRYPSGAVESKLIPFDNLAPVLLTPEIFKSVGFRFSNVHLWYQNTDEFIISHHKDGAFYCPFIEHIESPVIKYLHELQNLYFTLTKKELEISR